jgi:hypothetical protein
MGGTLLNKRYIKRKKTEEGREEGEVVDAETAVSSMVTSTGGSTAQEIAVVTRKRRKQASPKADISTTDTHSDVKHRVSFNSLPPSVVSIDGLGSQILQRFRDSIWYTVRVETVHRISPTGSQVVSRFAGF